MKSFFLLLFFSSIFILSFAQEENITFHKSKIEIPEGFTQLSEEGLVKFKSNIFNRPIMTVYEKSDSGTELERIIIYYDSLPGIKNMKFDQIVAIRLNIMQEGGLSYHDLKTDLINHCITGITVINGKVSLFGFSVDDYGVMGFQFDKSQGLDEPSKLQFENMLKSTKHSSPYKYVPRENPEAEEAKKDMKISGWFIALGFLAMVVVWLVRKYAVNN